MEGDVGGRFGVGGVDAVSISVLSIVVPGDDAELFIHR